MNLYLSSHSYGSNEINFFLLVYIINNTDLKELLPETSGMIILLIGCLAMMNGVYVGLVVSGPLNEDLEQE